MLKNILYYFGIILILNTLQTQAANIVYPKSDDVIIDSPRTFFIGSENPELPLKINDKEVSIHPSGGFWHTVELEIGKNIFTIDNGEEVQIYKITRPDNVVTKQNEPQATIFETPVIIEVKDDNVPLRSTPVDWGMNRLIHLQKGHQLTAIGELNDFYKIQLGRDDYAWIGKNFTKKTELSEIPKAKILSYSYEETEKKRIFKLKLSQKCPYTLYEYNGIDLTVYNIEGLPLNKYEFHINHTGKLFGYKSYYNEDNELVIEVKNQPVINKEKPLEGIKITIDPGHGGAEYGAIGCLGDKEKDINLAIANKLVQKLKAAGATVFMTRTNDTYVSLYDRVKISNQYDSDIFISLHNNALPDRLADQKSSGSEAYYFYFQSKELAKAILNALTTNAETKNNGVKAQSFAVLRNTESLCVLLEIAYKINPADNARLRDDKFQNKAADGILKGLENYLYDLQ